MPAEERQPLGHPTVTQVTGIFTEYLQCARHIIDAGNTLSMFTFQISEAVSNHVSVCEKRPVSWRKTKQRGNQCEGRVAVIEAVGSHQEGGF